MGHNVSLPRYDLCLVCPYMIFCHQKRVQVPTIKSSFMSEILVEITIKIYQTHHAGLQLQW